MYIFFKHKASILVWSRKLKQEWCEDWLQSIRSDKLQNKQSYKLKDRESKLTSDNNNNNMVSPLSLSFFTFFLFLFLSHPQAQAQSQSDPQSPTNDPPTICIIGSGIGGSSVAHFLRLYSSSSNSNPFSIHIFERNGVVGGRMATVNVTGHTFEAGASILHPKNYHAVNYTQLLGLKNKNPPSSSTSDSFSLGIWDGQRFVFKTLSFSSKIPFVDKIVSLANSLLMFLRYGFSLLKMQTFVEVCLLFSALVSVSVSVSVFYNFCFSLMPTCFTTFFLYG